jgi:hypothetical protein
MQERSGTDEIVEKVTNLQIEVFLLSILLRIL